MKSLKYTITVVALLLTLALLFVGCNKQLEELDGKVNQNAATAESAIGAAVNKAATELSAAKLELQEALAAGDKVNADALAEAVTNFTAALEAAKKLAADDNAAMKAALENSDAVLQSAIDELSAAMTERLAALDAKTAENAADLSAEVETLTALITAAQAAADAAQTDVDALETALDEAVTTLGDAIDATAKQLNEAVAKKADSVTLNAKANELALLINAAQAAADAAQADADALEAKLDEAITALEGTIAAEVAALRNQINGTNTDATSLTERVEQLAELIEAAQSAADAAQADLDALADELNDAIATLNNTINTKVASLQSAINKKADAATLVSEVNRLTGLINAAQNAANAAQADADALEKALNNAITTINETINTKVASLQSAIDKKADAATLETKVTELTALITAAQNAANAAQADADALETALNNAITTVNASIAAVQDKLDAYITSNDATVGEMKTEAAAIKALAQSAKDIADAATTSAAANKTSIDELNTKVAALEASLTALDGRVTMLETQMATAIKKIDMSYVTEGGFNYLVLTYTFMNDLTTEVRVLIPEKISASSNASDKITDGALDEKVTVNTSDSNVSAVLPSGTTLNGGADTITLNVEQLANANPDSIVISGEGMTSVAFDIEIPEVADTNTGVIVITLKGQLAKNLTSVALYHGADAMTVAASAAEVDAHNEYYYDAATGDLTIGTTSFSNFTVAFCSYAAKIGETYYATLEDAFAAAKTGDTIELLGDQFAGGLVINKSVTIDFGGYTYTFTTPAVGSAGTTTNGFQILKGNDVALKNGTLTVADDHKSEYYILVQNYANLTVEDMVLDGTNLDKWSTIDGDSYTLSNNCGTVNVQGATTIIANDEGDLAFAFDVCKYASYEPPVVTINTTGKIFGAFEVSEEIKENLVIEAGAFTDVTALDYAADGANVTVEVAKIGETVYESLAAAYAAAKDGDTIVLLYDLRDAGLVIDKSVTIDFGGYTYTFTTPAVGSAGTTTNGFQILKGNDVALKNGTLTVADDHKSEYAILIQNYANLTVEDMLLDGTNLDHTMKVSYVLSINCGTNALLGDTSIVANDSGIAPYAFDLYDYSAAGYTLPTLTINTSGKIYGDFEVSDTCTLEIVSGEFTCANANYYLADGANVKVEAAKIGDTVYPSFEAAYEAAQSGDTIVLLWDVRILGFTVDKNITIDLNGYTWSGIATSSAASSLITVKSGASLTLTGDGLVTYLATQPDTDWGDGAEHPYPGYANNTIVNRGVLIIDGVTVENRTAKGGASYAIDCYAGSALTVKSGNVVQTGGDIAIRMYVSSATSPVNVTVEGGNITGRRAIWIHLTGSDSNTAPKANLTITGGTLTTTAPDADLAIYSYSYGNSFANTNVVISGGVFNGNVAFGGGYKGDCESVTVTGGTFNGYLGRYLANDGWEDIAVAA